MLSSLGEAIAVSKAVTIIIQIILQGVAIHREHVAGLLSVPDGIDDRPANGNLVSLKTSIQKCKDMSNALGYTLQEQQEDDRR